MILSTTGWILLSLLLVSVSASTSITSAQDVTGFDFKILETPLPKALSDFTAVADYDAEKVYLQGGCDSVNGNQYSTVIGQFVCDSISLKSYIFDLNTTKFTETAPMPVARYRHAAALVNNQVWVVGGRDVNDNIITTVDVYSIADGNWTTYNDLNETYHVSDLAGFAGPDGLAYFAAGYNFTYVAQANFFSIDPVASTQTQTLVVAPLAPLLTARGDLSAVTANDDDQTNATYALMTGGFTDENMFCDPLASSERYDFASDAWIPAADLLIARGDMALVFLNDRIFAIAGERQIANICQVDPTDPPQPGEETVPIVDVEWYNATFNTWTDIEPLPTHRFRFAAIGYRQAIYSFGGQLAYNDSCKCFKTSDEVIVYTEHTSGAVASSSLFIALILSITGAALWM